MRAAVYMGARRFEIQELPVPVPGPGNVLVKVRYCGICGTDVHTFMYDVTPPGSQLGHEYSGTVVALGDGVDRWAVGDRIIGGGGEPPKDFVDPIGSEPRFNYRAMGPGREPMWARGYAEFVDGKTSPEKSGYWSRAREEVSLHAEQFVHVMPEPAEGGEA